MNVLFLSLADLGDYSTQSIYGDLLKTFAEHGHDVYSVSPCEPGGEWPIGVHCYYGIHDLKVQTGRLTKCGMVEKGISLLKLPFQIKAGLEKQFCNVDFDLVLYATPPVSLVSIVRWVKKRKNAVSYLMLKDIFPQNAIDINVLSTSGLKGLAYRFYKWQERSLYAVSDFIGCMSPANVRYVLQHYPSVDQNKVEICPNSFIPLPMSAPDGDSRSRCLEKYGIPDNELVFVYGGNLGKPQDIPFVVECVKANEAAPKGHILIVGTGTELSFIRACFDEAKPRHATLIPGLPKEEYEKLIVSCDVGLIFLDVRFTIPNFPSRLLSYLQAGMPVICATDDACDMGDLAESEGFGIRVSSGDVLAFSAAMDRMGELDRREMGRRARALLEKRFTSEHAYQVILSHFKENHV